MKSRRSVKIISFIFTFFLAGLFSVLYVGIGFHLGFFNNLGVVRAIDVCGYYNQVYDDMYSSSEEVVAGVGLPSTVLADVITLDYIYIHTKNYMDKSLSGQAVEVNAQQLKDKLTDNIKAYYLKANLNNSYKMEQDITLVTDQIGKKYETIVAVDLPNEINENKARYQGVIIVAMLLSALCIVFFGFILLKIHKYKHQGLRYIMYAIFASSALIILAAIINLVIKSYDRSYIEPNYYREMLGEYLKWDIMLYIYIGGVSILVGLGLMYFIHDLKVKIIH